jgi:hypothetical protein
MTIRLRNPRCLIALLLAAVLCIGATSSLEAEVASEARLVGTSCAPLTDELLLASTPLHATEFVSVSMEGCSGDYVGCMKQKCDCGGLGQPACCDVLCTCVCAPSCCSNGSCTVGGEEPEG